MRAFAIKDLDKRCHNQLQISFFPQTRTLNCYLSNNTKRSFYIDRFQIEFHSRSLPSLSTTCGWLCKLLDFFTFKTHTYLLDIDVPIHSIDLLEHFSSYRQLERWLYITQRVNLRQLGYNLRDEKNTESSRRKRMDRRDDKKIVSAIMPFFSIVTHSEYYNYDSRWPGTM